MVNTSKQRIYNWYSSPATYFLFNRLHGIADKIIRYISMVAASCMVLYGYDAAVFNAVQGSKNWASYWGHPGPNQIGAVNTATTVGGIIVGWFLSAPISDHFGRRVAMFLGSLLVIV